MQPFLKGLARAVGTASAIQCNGNGNTVTLAEDGIGACSDGLERVDRIFNSKGEIASKTSYTCGE
jgi:hypothetical protein